jgi:gamma-glutamylcyclotransferase (GGCT)/AIG2-like uncharacterized protein YtfP
MEPFVSGEGIETSVAGDVYDTGLGYPAATFGGSALIFGRVYQLYPAPAALAALDEVEGAVRGLYRRVAVTTVAGQLAWAYECGDRSLLVQHIAGGDWLQRA